MDLRCKSKFTREQKIAIVEEFEKGALSGKEIAEKYGIKYPSLIANWRTRLLKPRVYLRKSEKSSIFAPEIKPQVADEVPMKKRTRASGYEKNLGPSSRTTLRAGRPVGKYCLQAVWPCATGMVSTERDL